MTTNESAGNTKLADSLLEIEQKVRIIAKNPVIYSPALIYRDGIPIVRRNTITMIQGKQGAHKSRFAQMLASLIISGNNSPDQFLGFTLKDSHNLTAVYIDTERNVTEELPVARQNIMINAGYDIDEPIEKLHVTSIKHVERKNRIKSIRDFLNLTRSGTTDHLFVFLDIASDCVENYNDPKENVLLMDYLNNMSENHDCSILIVIHENFREQKATGATGTQAGNKASTIMSIGYIDNGRDERSDILKIKFLKVRHSKPLAPFHARYSESTDSLELSEYTERVSQNEKSTIEHIAKVLPSILSIGEISQQQVLNILCEAVKCSKNTLKRRLTEIEEQNVQIILKNGDVKRLAKNSANGKMSTYSLKSNNVDDNCSINQVAADIEIVGPLKVVQT
jgi:hypothetical protein